MSVKVYLDDDADLLDLQKKVCAVIGFGSQGHAHALNLRDSGIEVIVGLYPGSKSIAIAKEYGFLVLGRLGSGSGSRCNLFRDARSQDRGNL
jgi:ketol-acid reductoisomerase